MTNALTTIERHMREERDITHFLWPLPGSSKCVQMSLVRDPVAGRMGTLTHSLGSTYSDEFSHSGMKIKERE
jgi:hypothetical protein